MMAINTLGETPKTFIFRRGKFHHMGVCVYIFENIQKLTSAIEDIYIIFFPPYTRQHPDNIRDKQNQP